MLECFAEQNSFRDLCTGFGFHQDLASEEKEVLIDTGMVHSIHVVWKGYF